MLPSTQAKTGSAVSALIGVSDLVVGIYGACETKDRLTARRVVDEGQAEGQEITIDITRATAVQLYGPVRADRVIGPGICARWSE